MEPDHARRVLRGAGAVGPRLPRAGRGPELRALSESSAERGGAVFGRRHLEGMASD